MSPRWDSTTRLTDWLTDRPTSVTIWLWLWQRRATQGNTAVRWLGCGGEGCQSVCQSDGQWAPARDTPIQRVLPAAVRPLLSWYRVPHFWTRTCLEENKNLGHGSRRESKPIIVVPTRASSNLTVKKTRFLSYLWMQQIRRMRRHFSTCVHCYAFQTTVTFPRVNP
jgi:hypothetical protein